MSVSGGARPVGLEASFFRPTRLEYSLSVGVSVILNLLFCWIFFTEGTSKAPPPEEPIEPVQWVALSALGEPAPPQAVPRIVAPPTPPPPVDEAVSLAREIKKKEPEKKEPKKKELEKKPPPPKKTKRAQPDKKKTKPVTLDSLFSSSDERADKGPRRGSRKGHASGTSTQELDSTEMSSYISKVSVVISRFLSVPNAISPRARKRLHATIHLKVGTDYKMKGEPRWVKKSGNKLFDDAVMRAVMSFSPDGPGTLPLPKDPKARKAVLRQGLNLVIDAEQD